MTINEFYILILVLSVSVSLVGISIQIMRLISTTTETFKKSQPLVDNFVSLSDKITQDYSELSTHILTLTSSLSKIGTEVIAPIIGIFKFLQKYTKK